MVLPTPEAIRELELLAETEPEQLLSVAGLVKSGFMRIEDIGALRSAGLRFWQTGDDDAPDVAVGAAAFLFAARQVAEQRAADAVLEHAPSLPN